MCWLQFPHLKNGDINKTYLLGFLMKTGRLLKYCQTQWVMPPWTHLPISLGRSPMILIWFHHVASLANDRSRGLISVCALCFYTLSFAVFLNAATTWRSLGRLAGGRETTVQLTHHTPTFPWSTTRHVNEAIWNSSVWLTCQVIANTWMLPGDTIWSKDKFYQLNPNCQPTESLAIKWWLSYSVLEQFVM